VDLQCPADTTVSPAPHRGALFSLSRFVASSTSPRWNLDDDDDDDDDDDGEDDDDDPCARKQAAASLRHPAMRRGKPVLELLTFSLWNSATVQTPSGDLADRPTRVKYADGPGRDHVPKLLRLVCRRRPSDRDRFVGHGYPR